MQFLSRKISRKNLQLHRFRNRASRDREISPRVDIDAMRQIEISKRTRASKFRQGRRHRDAVVRNRRWHATRGIKARCECRIEKSGNIEAVRARWLYVRACTGHVPGAMYLDESHGNSARERAHIHARMRVRARVTRVRVYVRTSICPITCVCSRSLSDTGAIFLSVPWDKARGGEITRRREEQTHARCAYASRRGRRGEEGSGGGNEKLWKRRMERAGEKPRRWTSG